MKVAQSCPTLCNSMDGIVHGIRQARILEWLAFYSPGSLPDPRIEPGSPVLQVDSLLSEPPRLGAIKVKKKKSKKKNPKKLGMSRPAHFSLYLLCS